MHYWSAWAQGQRCNSASQPAKGHAHANDYIPSLQEVDIGRQDARKSHLQMCSSLECASHRVAGSQCMKCAHSGPTYVLLCSPKPAITQMVGLRPVTSRQLFQAFLRPFGIVRTGCPKTRPIRGRHVTVLHHTAKAGPHAASDTKSDSRGGWATRNESACWKQRGRLH